MNKKILIPEYKKDSCVDPKSTQVTYKAKISKDIVLIAQQKQLKRQTKLCALCV
ncbi:hypothetical protein KBC55_04315 [Patescibacteria group bacterium]|nr:hypothetical protein [Patescibacteria group bacterium]